MADEVLIVDDDPMMRDLIEAALRHAGITVKTYPSAEAMLSAGVAFREQGAGGSEGMQAQCLLLDLEMPGTSGLELLEKLKQQRTKGGEGTVACPVLMITGHASVRTAVQSMKLGAVDIFEKPFEIDALVKLVRETLDKDRVALAAASDRQGVRDRITRLSPRERELLDAIVEGRSTKMIADSLGISARTVDHHRANLMEKMAAENVADLVRMAVKADHRSVKR